MENLCINMSKITKLRIHQKSMYVSKRDCPMKSKNSGIVSTVAHFRCWCNLVNWKLCFVYCTFVSLFFDSPLSKLTQAFYCLKERWRTGWKVYLIQLLKPIKSTSELITNAKTSCAYTIVFMASSRGEI